MPMVRGEPVVAVVIPFIACRKIGERPIVEDIVLGDGGAKHFYISAIASESFRQVDFGHMKAARIEVSDVDDKSRLVMARAGLRGIPYLCRGIVAVQDTEREPELVQERPKGTAHGPFLGPEFNSFWLIRPRVLGVIVEDIVEERMVVLPTPDAFASTGLIDDPFPRNDPFFPGIDELLSNLLRDFFDMSGMSFRVKSR
jgi:hypothetical protein